MNLSYPTWISQLAGNLGGNVSKDFRSFGKAYLLRQKYPILVKYFFTTFNFLETS